MSSEQFRENAAECLDWARTAKSEKERGVFLQMAEAWLAAALRCEGSNLRGHLGATGPAARLHPSHPKALAAWMTIPSPG
jgi:hypothetical protein